MRKVAQQGSPRGESGTCGPVSSGRHPRASGFLSGPSSGSLLEGWLASPRLPGCCRLHDNRVRARRRSERVVSSSETKSPRPHTGRAPGRRRWNSSGKAADVAGGPCPGPGSADASAAPRPQAGSPGGELAQRSVLFPSGRPARFSQ